MFNWSFGRKGEKMEQETIFEKIMVESFSKIDDIVNFLIQKGQTRNSHR